MKELNEEEMIGTEGGACKTATEYLTKESSIGDTLWIKLNNPGLTENIRIVGAWGGANNNLLINETNVPVMTDTFDIKDKSGALVFKVKKTTRCIITKRFWKNKGSTEQTKANKVGIKYRAVSKSNKGALNRTERYIEFYW